MTLFALLLMYGAPACQYEDASELKVGQSCYWDGGYNTFVATRTADTVESHEVTKNHKDITITHVTYAYVDGHIEKGSWEQ